MKAMEGGINQHTLRTMLASLLNSQITPNEMRRFAHDLDDPDIVRQLQKAVYQIAETLHQSASRQNPRSEGEETALLAFIQRKRLSKEKVRGRMMSIAPNLPLKDDGDTRTMRQLVQLFVETGSNRANQFIRTFGDEGQDDPYLKGIIGRDKR